MKNALDVQAQINDLIEDVTEAIAAERSDWAYDLYLSHGEPDEREQALHDERLDILYALLVLLKEYHSLEWRYQNRREA
jgi:hypothetical protein